MRTEHSLKEFLSGETAKELLVRQGFYIEEEPATIDGTSGRAEGVTPSEVLSGNYKGNY